MKIVVPVRRLPDGRKEPDFDAVGIDARAVSYVYYPVSEDLVEVVIDDLEILKRLLPRRAGP